MTTKKSTSKKKPVKKSPQLPFRPIVIPVEIGQAPKETRISSVAFRTSVQVGQFKHVHIEAAATVGHNDSPTEALMAVKAFVRRELLLARREETPATPPWAPR